MVELRQMPEIQKIAKYLQTMSFKRRLFGGCDTENVLDHFAVVTEQYETIILTILAQQADSATRQKIYAQDYDDFLSNWRAPGEEQHLAGTQTVQPAFSSPGPLSPSMAPSGHLGSPPATYTPLSVGELLSQIDMRMQGIVY